jgi:hypothetical protein
MYHTNRKQNTTVLPMTWWKGIFGQWEASHTSSIVCWRLPRASWCRTYAWILFYSNIKSPMILHVNNEKTFGKSPLRSFYFYFLTFKGISIVSLYFWFFYTKHDSASNDMMKGYFGQWEASHTSSIVCWRLPRASRCRTYAWILFLFKYQITYDFTC